MAELEVTTLEVGALACACYLLRRADAARCLVIDPGADAEQIIAAMQEHALEPDAFLLTHSHFDHIGGLAVLHERYPQADIACHPICGQRMQSPQDNLSGMMGSSIRAPGPTRELTDGEVFPYAGTELTALFVPGHAPGHLVYHAAADGALFSGDTLFQGSMGRTDFPGSSYDLLMSGLRDKVLVLPGRTRVYPGHGPATTLAAEKEKNPFIRDLG
jgi:hydroxyacylglutathione hydrolase